MWEMLAGRKWAIYHLQLLSPPPGRLINLALEYGVSTWIPSAYSNIVRTPWDDITSYEITGLDARVVRLVGRAKDALVRERHILVLNIPEISPIASVGCHDHAKCSVVWFNIWVKKVYPALLHPDKALPLRELEGFIRNLTFPGMNANCLSDQLNMLTGLNAFHVEERIIKEAGQLVVALC